LLANFNAFLIVELEQHALKLVLKKNTVVARKESVHQRENNSFPEAVGCGDNCDLFLFAQSNIVAEASKKLFNVNAL
jgi:hypothetical protein